MVEGAAELTGGGNAVLFLHTAHLHTHMAGLNDYHDTQWVQRLLDALLDLQRHSFLDLQPVGLDVHYTGNLRQSRDVAVRNIGNVCLAVERQHMVFAE